MKYKPVMVVLMQFMLVGTPLNSFAASPDRGQDPEQLFNIGWELAHDCRNHREAPRPMVRQHVALRHKRHTHTSIPQGNLLQELLPPTVNRYGSGLVTKYTNAVQRIGYQNKEQETALLEEILAEVSIQ
jgi:hypothetical protein